MYEQCGEEKPQCSNCKAHSAECVYEAVTSRRTTPKPATPGPSTPMSQEGAPPAFTLEHMELLHHYTASTSLTFSSTPQAVVVWQDRVPRLALNADYVLQTLLAVSSLHLSQLRPHARSSYWSQGVQLYHAALSKAQKEMENVTEANCTEVYVFSMLTCFYSLAQNGALATRSDHGESIDDEEGEDLLGWVFLFRGTKALLTLPHQKILHEGVLAPIFQSGARRARRLRAYPTVDTRHVMDDLREVVPDPAEREIYRDAIHHLQKSFHAVYGRAAAEIETTDIFVWLFDVSDEYMDRLRRHEGPALAIFICFSLLVGQLQGVWWAKGWGEWISVRLRDTLLDEERSFSGRLMELLALVNDTTHDRVEGAAEMDDGGSSSVVSPSMEASS